MSLQPQSLFSFQHVFVHYDFAPRTVVWCAAALGYGQLLVVPSTVVSRAQLCLLALLPL